MLVAFLVLILLSGRKALVFWLGLLLFGYLALAYWF